MDNEEQHIITEIRSGNQLTFEKLFREYFKRLTLYAFKFVHNEEIAKDIVQEFFIRLYESKEKMNIKSSLKHYLFQSVRNHCLNYIKQKGIHEKYRTDTLYSGEISEADPYDKIAENELEIKIAEIVSHLPDQCQKIFLLSRQDGMKNKEIAEQLNISVRTVETQISKALKVLREKLSSYI